MNVSLLAVRIATFSLLAIAISQVSALSQTPTASPDDQIRQIEKQIADLQAKLADLRNRELLPAPRQVADGVFIPESWIDPMRWRCIGPAIMGGRVTAIAVAEDEPTCYWIATASGGLLRTINNGVTFEHQFDHEAAVSLGAVAVAPSNRNIVWVGTGEANPRNSVSYGNGVYKSVDGGKTWTNMGLQQTFQIGKVLIHPKNPDIVYVAALGRLYGPNSERGLFKTTDGGQRWQKVLFIDDRTGIIDVAMHPTDSETLIAAAWERRRDEFDSFRGDAKKPDGADEYAPAVLYGANGGLYRTTDGGKNFTRLSQGLPGVKMGRIGLDFSRQHPDTLFAIIDTEQAGAGAPPPPQAEVGYLGIAGADDMQGVKLTAVTDGSPAQKTGLQSGDLIVQFEGIAVKDYNSLVADLKRKKPGDKVKLAVVRDNQKKEFEVVLGFRRGSKGASGGRPNLGIQVEGTPGGVLVSEVLPGSPAERAGLKLDDVITQIDAVAISDRRDISRALIEKKNGDAIKVVYLRGKEKNELEIKLEEYTPNRARPNADTLGGQMANAQGWQGPDGVNTGGLFKSTDGGRSWARVNSIGPRPFYFSVVRVDPLDDQVIYVLGLDLQRSTDGGKTFTAEGINAGLHADQHDLWIDPKNNKHLLAGCDGGFYVTYDRGSSWQHMNRVALGQFYHVCVDNRQPYRVYGGLQDNGSWGGPSNTRRAVGASNEDWVFVNGGDGFQCQVDRANPDLVYAESQDGIMMRRDLRLGSSSFIRPEVRPGLGKLRFNWNTPFVLSHHNSSLFYAAGNYVFRSVEQGEQLRPISPEITRTRRGSATALSESPRNSDLLWVGTDDGAVQITRDGGRTWTDVSHHFLKAGLPGPRWVAAIEASRWEEGRAYVTFDGHRSDDDEPYLFVSDDFGQNWKSIRANLPRGSTHVLREDHRVKDLLYVGTEFGAWVSIDRGRAWTRLNGQTLPTVAVHEFAQPDNASEIVAATHGRSLWVLDVAALRQYTPVLIRENAPKLLTPAPVIRWQIQPGGSGPFMESMRRFLGENPPRGATIDYILPKKTARIAVTITDISGRTVAELKPGTAAGLNRVIWNFQTLNLPRPKGVSDLELLVNPYAQALFGSYSAAGTYRVVFKVDGSEQSALLVVQGDPNAPRAAESAVDAVEQERAIRRLERQKSNTTPTDY